MQRLLNYRFVVVTCVFSLSYLQTGSGTPISSNLSPFLVLPSYRQTINRF